MRKIAYLYRHVLVMVIRIFTFSIGIILLVCLFADKLQLMPMDIGDAFSKMSKVPFSANVKVFFNLGNYLNIAYPVSMFPAFTLVKFMLFVVSGNFGAVFSSISVTHTTLVSTSSGEVHSQYSDALESVGAAIFVYLFLILCLLPLAFVVCPIVIVLDFIKLVNIIRA